MITNTVGTFLYQNAEIIILSILLSFTIYCCAYLYRLSFKAQFAIPIIRSEQGKWFYRYKLRSKQLRAYKMIKNSTSMFQMYKITDKNNLSGYDQFKQINKNKSNLFSDKSKDLPFVSIIVPARNEEKYIERCILSLLDQDYPRFEIIVIDDNSTDATPKILKNILDNTKKKIVLASPTTDTSTIISMAATSDKLKIITLKDKPKRWTGKTWASQKGFLQSKGDILLFTDADTYYSKSDTILQAVQYMQGEKLDVLTGIPTSEKLTNFWSKITIPMWDFISILFGVGSIAEVNNPKSKIAYLMGSFFLIKRQVFINVGTFESVHEEIQEDKALGIIIKEKGYKLRLVKLRNMVYTLWADDLVTLWRGIGRTVSPLVMENKRKIVFNLLVIFFSCVFPFILFLFTLSLSIHFLTVPHIQTLQENSSSPELYLPVLSMITCLFVFVMSSIKRSEREIFIAYTLGSPFGSAFVLIACIYYIVPLLIYGNSRPITWQGRRYSQKKEHEMEDLHYSLE